MEDYSKEKKFHTGPAHVFNPTPSNEEESGKYGDALAKSGNYPVGTSDCFNVGISGGCGPDCFVYRKGLCETGEELAADETDEYIKSLYL